MHRGMRWCDSSWNTPGRDQYFPDVAAVEAHLRRACATFGPLDDARWREVTLHGARLLGDGRYALAYDPGIISALRGDSTVAEMRRRNALVRVVEFPGIGHAPWLMSDDQINVVRDFLLSPALPP